MEKSTRRETSRCSESARYVCSGPLVIDTQNRHVMLHNAVIPVPPCTFDYLLTLARNSPEPVSYRSLANGTSALTLDAIDIQDLTRLHIFLLRRVLEENPGKPRHILAVEGFGYKLVF